jgi:hypothetical protein
LERILGGNLRQQCLRVANLKIKWIIKVKRNGVFLARPVACGYCLVPGIDLTEIIAPKAKDMTLYSNVNAAAQEKWLLRLHFYKEINKEIIYMETAHGMTGEKDFEYSSLWACAKHRESLKDAFWTHFADKTFRPWKSCGFILIK